MSVRALTRATRDFERVCEAVRAKHSCIQSVALADKTGDVNSSADVFHWRVSVTPPAESVYAGYAYDLLFTLSPLDYPIAPPEVRVLTPIFSPVVSSTDGKVCEGLLRNENWKPTSSPVDTIAQVVAHLFLHYAALDVLNEEAAAVLHSCTEGCEEAFRQRVIAARMKGTHT